MTAVERNDVRASIDELGFAGAFNVIDFAWIRDHEFHALREDYVTQPYPEARYEAAVKLASYVGVEL